MRWLLAFLLAIASCHHETPAKPQPGETPPLPPASGTPIGYLLDARTSLALRDDQVAKLQELDTTLSGRLETIDAQLRVHAQPRPTAGPVPTRGGSHRRRRIATGSGAGSGTPRPAPTGGGSRLAQERAATVREGVQQALAVLDPDQQVAARKLLAEHDFDVAAPTTTPPTNDDDAGSDGDEPTAPEP
jgi:hypothetical protein